MAAFLAEPFPKEKQVTLILAVLAVPSQDKAPDFPNPAKSPCCALRPPGEKLGCEPRTSKLEGGSGERCWEMNQPTVNVI